MAPYPGFLGPAYQAAAYMADNERCINLYAEPVESPRGATAGALLHTPGFLERASVSQAPIRGTFSQNGRFFFVAGFAFYELSPTNFGTQLRGTVQADTNPVTFCSNGDAGHQLGLTSGDHFYLFDLNSLAFSTVLTSGATMCDYLDGRALVLDSSTSTLRISNQFDFSVFDPTQVAQRTAGADRWVAMKVCNRLIYLLGSQTSEVWWNDGGAPFPYSPIQEAFMSQGIGAPWSLALLESDSYGSLLWVAANAQGRNSIVRTKGYEPTRASTFAIENIIGGYATGSDAVASSYQENGHPFYVVTFPTGGQTWALDARTGWWHERAYWNVDAGAYEPSKALWFAATDTIVLCGSLETGEIYQQSTALYTDVDGSAIRRMRQPPRISADAQDRFIMNGLQVVMDVGQGLNTGQGSDPQMMLSCSRDGGKKFGPERWSSAGKMGEFSTRVMWTRLGQARNFVPRFVMSDPVPWRLVGCEVDISGGIS